MVCKGYAQEEGTVYRETFSPIVSLEVVRTLLAYIYYKGFKVYQMDIKSTFLMESWKKKSILNNLKDFLTQERRAWYADGTMYYMV